jgi:glyoxylase-like metal-dependent hydrolase (beta-lactamase superfamily II)
MIDIARRTTRRTFLADLGRGGLALALVSVAGCAGPSSSSTRSVAASAGSGGPASPDPSELADASPPATALASGEAASAAADGLWERVDLGFVSAYVLLRGGEAAVVDTGVAGSEGEIQTALDRLGLNWTDVGHVILTHRHPDHAGSIAAVLEAARDATGYIGAADLSGVTAPRPLTPLADGDTVFDLRIVATPGHTAGHVAVLDEGAGILVAGDALGTTGGALAGSNPQFTEDPTAAAASVRLLGGLRYETLLVGHGEPILSGASAQVAALAAG